MTSRDSALNNDQRLIEAATYSATKGFTLSPCSQEDISKKFTEFKGLVRRGSFTLAQLEESVYSRYGVGVKPDEQMGVAGSHPLQKWAQQMGIKVANFPQPQPKKNPPKDSNPA